MVEPWADELAAASTVKPVWTNFGVWLQSSLLRPTLPLHRQMRQTPPNDHLQINTRVAAFEPINYKLDSTCFFD